MRSAEHAAAPDAGEGPREAGAAAGGPGVVVGEPGVVASEPGMASRVADDRDDGRDETPNERADRNWNEILQELRVAQTGTQILGAFLLAVAFQPRFTELDEYQRSLYLVLVALAGVAASLGLAPVSLHRAYFGRGEKVRIVRIASRLLAADLVVLALLAAGVTSLIFDFILGRTAGFAALGAGAVVVVGLWVVLPRLGIRRRAGRPRHESATPAR